MLLRTSAGTIMVPFVPVLVSQLRAGKEITVSDARADLLAGISAVTIDRMLAD